LEFNNSGRGRGRGGRGDGRRIPHSRRVHIHNHRLSSSPQGDEEEHDIVIIPHHPSINIVTMQRTRHKYKKIRQIN